MYQAEMTETELPDGSVKVRLRLLENEQEVGGGVFWSGDYPAEPDYPTAQADAARDDAQATADEWLASRPSAAAKPSTPGM